MKIAILTFHRAFNCGALLQAWALQTYLQRQGHEVEFPDVNRVGWTNGEPKFQTRRKGILKFVAYLLWLRRRVLAVGMAKAWRAGFTRFVHQYLNLVRITADQIHTSYDCVIVGSDQVWNPIIAKDQLPLFLCRNMSENVHKIAYAISVGDDPRCVDAQQGLFRKCVSRFDALSVRENAANMALKQFVAKPLEEVVDPTLLLVADAYSCLEDESCVPRDPYLFAYFVLGPTKKFAAYVRELGRILKIKVVLACSYHDSRAGDPFGIMYGVTPGKMLSLIKHAKYVVAASFHGTVFALQYQKPLLVLREKADVIESRPAALVRKVGLEKRVVTLANPSTEALRKLSEPMPCDLTQRLSDLRKPSEDWLQIHLKEIAR